MDRRVGGQEKHNKKEQDQLPAEEPKFHQAPE